MKVKLSASSSFLRKVPLNTIVLPPLDQLSNRSNEIILVNKELMVARPPTLEPSAPGKVLSSSTSSLQPQVVADLSRIAQLEQNIRFLQEQHELMLQGLHEEIEGLKTRNRELQFQLVFVKGTLPSSPSSPEDDNKHKVYTSPKPYNVTPLQVEILEKEMGELRLQQQETDSRNVYLSAIVDEQKRKLERYEREKDLQQQVPSSDPELLRKLDDAEAMIRRLRRENSDLVFQVQRGSEQFQQAPPRSGGSNNRGRHHRNNGHFRGGTNNGWFPPLHSQSFWQQQNGASAPSSGRGEGSSSALPSLNEQAPAAPQYHQNHHHRRGGDNNNYRGGGEGGKKYRGYNKSSGKPT